VKHHLKRKTKMSKLFFLVAFLFVFNCTNRKGANFPNSKYILTQRPIEKGGYKLYDDGSINYLFDTLHGKVFGNFFEFDLNSNLITYAFKTDSIHSTYSESYDPETHTLEAIEGTPIVYETIDADSKPDSLFIQYLIANFSWEDIEFEISEDGKNFKKMPLYEHPKLKFIKVVEFGKDSRLLSRFFLVAKFKGRMTVTRENKIFYDTIDVTRRKR